MGPGDEEIGPLAAPWLTQGHGDAGTHHKHVPVGQAVQAAAPCGQSSPVGRVCEQEHAHIQALHTRVRTPAPANRANFI